MALFDRPPTVAQKRSDKDDAKLVYETWLRLHRYARFSDKPIPVTTREIFITIHRRPPDRYGDSSSCTRITRRLKDAARRGAIHGYWDPENKHFVWSNV